MITMPHTAPQPFDEHFMRIALHHAKRGEGTTSPNPAVGCILVKDNKIIATGYTGKGGRPHAEAIAIQKAGNNTKGATAYVTLEPCAHHGKTPPCAKSLIEAGITRCVIGVSDPFEKVCGQGIKQLEAAGIAVCTGVCEDEAYYLHRGFFSVQLRKRPWITVKIASTMDGKIATQSGESQWITGQSSRDYGHLLRARSDAILVGYHTALQDNPSLTCRLPGLESKSPLRLTIDYNHSLPKTLKLFQDQAHYPTWLITKEEEKGHPAKKQLVISEDNPQLFYPAILEALAENGVTSLFVEGGSSLVTHLLKYQLVDELLWFRAPMILGNEHRAAIGALDYETLSQAITTSPAIIKQIGNDCVEHYQLTSLPFVTK